MEGAKIRQPSNKFHRNATPTSTSTRSGKSRYYNREYENENRSSPTASPYASPLRERPAPREVSRSPSPNRYRSDYSRSQHEELQLNKSTDEGAAASPGSGSSTGGGGAGNGNGGLNVKDLANRFNSRAGVKSSFRPAWLKTKKQQQSSVMISGGKEDDSGVATGDGDGDGDASSSNHYKNRSDFDERGPSANSDRGMDAAGRIEGNKSLKEEYNRQGTSRSSQYKEDEEKGANDVAGAVAGANAGSNNNNGNDMMRKAHFWRNQSSQRTSPKKERISIASPVSKKRNEKIKSPSSKITNGQPTNIRHRSPSRDAGNGTSSNKHRPPIRSPSPHRDRNSASATMTSKVSSNSPPAHSTSSNSRRGRVSVSPRRIRLRGESISPKRERIASPLRRENREGHETCSVPVPVSPMRNNQFVNSKLKPTFPSKGSGAPRSGNFSKEISTVSPKGGKRDNVEDNIQSFDHTNIQSEEGSPERNEQNKQIARSPGQNILSRIAQFSNREESHDASQKSKSATTAASTISRRNFQLSVDEIMKNTNEVEEESGNLPSSRGPPEELNESSPEGNNEISYTKGKNFWSGQMNGSRTNRTSFNAMPKNTVDMNFKKKEFEVDVNRAEVVAEPKSPDGSLSERSAVSGKATRNRTDKDAEMSPNTRDSKGGVSQKAQFWINQQKNKNRNSTTIGGGRQIEQPSRRSHSLPPRESAELPANQLSAPRRIQNDPPSHYNSPQQTMVSGKSLRPKDTYQKEISPEKTMKSIITQHSPQPKKAHSEILSPQKTVPESPGDYKNQYKQFMSRNRQINLSLTSNEESAEIDEEQHEEIRQKMASSITPSSGRKVHLWPPSPQGQPKQLGHVIREGERVQKPLRNNMKFQKREDPSPREAIDRQDNAVKPLRENEFRAADSPGPNTVTLAKLGLSSHRSRRIIESDNASKKPSTFGSQVDYAEASAVRREGWGIATSERSADDVNEKNMKQVSRYGQNKASPEYCTAPRKSSWIKPAQTKDDDDSIDGSSASSHEKNASWQKNKGGVKNDKKKLLSRLPDVDSPGRGVPKSMSSVHRKSLKKVSVEEDHAQEKIVYPAKQNRNYSMPSPLSPSRPPPHSSNNSSKRRSISNDRKYFAQEETEMYQQPSVTGAHTNAMPKSKATVQSQIRSFEKEESERIDRDEIARPKLTKLQQYNRIVKSQIIATPQPAKSPESPKKTESSSLLITPYSTATTVTETDESQSALAPWTTPQRHRLSSKKIPKSPIKEDSQDDHHGESSSVITDTSSFLPVSEVKKRLWDNGETLKWQKDEETATNKNGSSADDKQASVFKSRFYRAAEIAKSNCVQNKPAGTIKKTNSFQDRMRKESTIPKIESTSNRQESKLELGSSNAETKHDSVAKLLAKLSSVKRDDPNTALEVIDSILKNEGISLEDKQSKPQSTANAFLPSSNEVGEEMSDEDSHSSEYDDSDSDASTVSSITNPTYMSGYGDSFSFSRKQHFQNIGNIDGRLNPHKSSRRSSGKIHQNSSRKTSALPPRQPHQSSSKIIEPIRPLRNAKTPARKLSRGASKAAKNSYGTYSHHAVVQRLASETAVATSPTRDQSYKKREPGSPAKSFTAGGSSTNNRGLLNKFIDWDEETQEKELDQRSSLRPPHSPGERLKRLAVAATKLNSDVDTTVKKDANRSELNVKSTKRLLYPQQEKTFINDLFENEDDDGGAWDPSSADFFGTNFFGVSEDGTQIDFDDPVDTFNVRLEERQHNAASKELARKFSKMEQAYQQRN